jgi:hypothetical protein
MLLREASVKKRHTMALAFASASHPDMSLIRCPEYIRLKQKYKQALRRWLQVEADASMVASRRRQKALKERDEASKKLILHNESCSVCRRDKLKVIRGGKTPVDRSQERPDRLRP